MFDSYGGELLSFLVLAPSFGMPLLKGSLQKCIKCKLPLRRIRGSLELACMQEEPDANADEGAERDHNEKLKASTYRAFMSIASFQ